MSSTKAQPGTRLQETSTGQRNPQAFRPPAEHARSWLLTSASQKETFIAASSSDADSVILDLEDAVAAEDKAQARRTTVDALVGGMNAWVRVNGPESQYWAADLAALSHAAGLQGIMLAMTETAEQVTATAERLPPGTPVIALIETALGLENAITIATAAATFRLAFGVGDFRRDTGAADTPRALTYARSRLVVASRVGRLPGAIDGPSVAATETELQEACSLTAEMGMTGKLCLASGTASTINSLLSPGEADIRWAKKLLTERATGAAIGDGSYLPRLAMAKKILALSETYGLLNV